MCHSTGGRGLPTAGLPELLAVGLPPPLRARVWSWSPWQGVSTCHAQEPGWKGWGKGKRRGTG